MAEYTLTITVQGVDQTAPAQQGMERLGVGGVAAGNILASALQKAAGAVVGFATDSAGAAGDFQQSMSLLQAASGASNAQMQALSATAVALGNDITLPGASAADAGTAMLELAKAGLTVDEAMAAAQGTLQLAAAAQTDVATAAQVTSGALNAFGLSGDQAVRIADQLAAGANASAASMTDLSQGFQQAGFAFSATGQHTDDLVASLALLTNVGLTGSDAGTALKNAMMQLMAPTDAAAATMQQYGINVRDAQGNMLPFRDIIGILQTSLGGLNEAQREAALKTMLQGDGMKAMIPLLDAGVIGFDAMKLKVNEAGAAQAMAAAQMTGFNGSLAGVANAVETLQLIIGGVLIPVLTTLLTSAVTPAINAMTTFAQSIINASDPLAAFGAAINPFMPIIAGLGTAILVAVVPGFVAWAAAALTAAAATLAALAPAIAIGAAVALLYVAWQNNFLGIRDITASVWAAIQPAFTQLVDWLGVMIPAAIQAAAILWTSTLWPALQSVGNFIIGTVIPALSQLASWLATNVPAAIASAVAAFQTISTAVQAVWTAVQTAWQNVVTTTTTAWAAITSAVQSGVSTVVGALSSFGSVLSTIAQAAWNTVVFVTSSAWAAIWAVVNPGIQQVVAGLQAGWATLSSIASAAWSAVVGVVAPALSAISGAVSSGVATVQSVWSAGMSTLTAVASSVWGAIQSVISAAVAVVRGVIQGVISFIQSTWGGAQQAAQAQTSAAWSAIQTLITGAMTAVRTAITAGVAVVQTIMKTAWAVVVAAAQNDFGKIPAIIQAGWDRVKAIMSAGVGAITAIAGTMAAAALSLGKSIVSGIISGVGSMASALGDKIKGMANSALSAAKAVLGIHSPSTVMAQQVGIPIVDGIVAGLGAAAPKLTGKMLELAGGMVDLVSKGVDAFGKLRDLGSISFGAIAQFTNTMQQAMGLFADMALQWDKAMMSAASQFARKSGEITDAMVKGVDFLLKLQQYQGVAPAVITAFADNLGFAMTELIRISTRELRIGMTAAVEFSLGAGKILDVLAKGVDALMKLRTLGDAVPGSFANFALQIVVLVQRVSEVAGWMDASTVAAAGRFAEGAGKVVGILGSGVDGLIKLATLSEPVPGSFQKFAIQIFALVQRVAEVATWISADAVAKAAVFADGAGKVLAIIGSGVENLTKLGNFQGVSGTALNIFVETVRIVVTSIAYVATLFTTQAVAAAAVFADGAGKVLGIIGSGVDNLTKLGTFQGISATAINIFVETVRVVVAAIAYVATLFAAEAVAAAAVFADGTGKVLSIIGSGVDNLTKLGTFQGISATAINIFVETVRVVVAAIAYVATLFTADAITAAAKFAEGAGKVLSIVGSGVDNLTKLGTFQGTSGTAINIFVETVRVVVAAIAYVATLFTVEAVAAAAVFADGAGKVLSIIGSGVDNLTKLGTFEGISANAINVFVETMRVVVVAIVYVATLFSVDALAAAVRFADSAGKVISMIGTGVDGFAKLATFAGIPGPALDLFTAAVVTLINTVIALANVVTVDALAAAGRLADGINQVIGVVAASFQAFTALGTASTSLSDFASNFIASLQKLITDFAAAVVPPATDIGAAVTINMANGIGSGIPAVQNATTSAINAVINILNAATGQVISPAMIIGNNIAIGIANGITAAAPAIQNAVNAAVNAALAAAQAALGIASPSKVFEQQIGLQMSAGMAQGILGGMPQVSAAVGEVSAVSAGALTTGASAGSSTSNSSSITIAPGAIVIDGAGQNADAVADAVMRRLELLIGGRLV